MYVRKAGGVVNVKNDDADVCVQNAWVNYSLLGSIMDIKTATFNRTDKPRKSGFPISL